MCKNLGRTPKPESCVLQAAFKRNKVIYLLESELKASVSCLCDSPSVTVAFGQFSVDIVRVLDSKHFSVLKGDEISYREGW
jgi:hypothetical protein